MSLAESSQVTYDVLIIGGGIVGTGIARDASLRGMSVVLFEKDDLSCGTTSRSSRLIHGGLRYLDTHDFGLVFKDLQEREKLLRIAPHLVHPLKFVVPNYSRSFYERIRLRAGMTLYDLLSIGKTIPSHKMLSAEQVIELEPSLKKEGLQGGALFYDCQAPFVERLSIENALSASEHEARIFTHSRVIGLKASPEAGSINIVEVEDEFSHARFEFKARVLVNAAGPWADKVLEHLLLEKPGEAKLRTTKGIHIAVPKVNDSAIILYAKTDNRLFFIIPWLDHTLIGTTDTDYSDDPGNSTASQEEIQYLLAESSNYVSKLSKKEVLYSYSGVRPLVRSDSSKNVGEVSRSYKIVDHRNAGSKFIISVIGVKITSYRIASKESTDLISRMLNRNTKCMTDKIPLPGANPEMKNSENESKIMLKKLGLDEKQISYLLGIYGTRFNKLIEIIESDPALSERFCPTNPDIGAEIILATREEFALSASDFLLRRVPISFSSCRGLDCVERVAQIMAKIFNWDKGRIAREILDYKLNLELQLPLTPKPMIEIG